jgi:hypothetical protein
MWFPTVLAAIIALLFGSGLYMKNIPIIYWVSFLATFINPGLNAPAARNWSRPGTVPFPLA